MGGITILEEHLCRHTSLATVIAVGMTMALAIAAIIFIFKQQHKYSKQCYHELMFMACILVIFITGFCVLLKEYRDTHIEYTITVDDTVSFNDFMEKYEIISIDGIEYRVKEK